MGADGYRAVMDVNPVDLGDIAAVFASAFALVAIVVSILSLRMSGKSANAAEISAEAAQRSADADEQMVALAKQAREEEARQVAAGETPVPGASWEVTRHGRHRLRVMNIGQTTAHNVRLDGAILAREFTEGQDVPPLTFFDVLEVKSMGDIRPLEVHWEDEPGGARKKWIYLG